MQVHEPVPLPLASLTTFPTALKKPFGAADLASLRAHVAAFGFSAVLNVAPDPDSRYVVLDGNTRVEDLRAAGVTSVHCIIHHDLASSFPDHEARRQDFVVGFDPPRKALDRKLLVELAAARAAAGGSLETLASVSPVRNLDRAIATALSASKAAQESPSPTPTAPLDTLTLMGPPGQIAAIRTHLDSIRTTLSDVAKVQEMLAQSRAHIEMTDEAFLGVFLAALSIYLDR